MGWKLPDDDYESASNQSYQDLIIDQYGVPQQTIAGANKAIEWPLDFLRTGYYSGGYINKRLGDGSWWTNRTTIQFWEGEIDFVYGYVLDVDDTYGILDLTVGDARYRGTGLAIRCLVSKG